MVLDAESLAVWTKGRWLGKLPSGIGGLAFDARRLSSGEAFVALRGDIRDGHDFVAQAALAGASAAIVERELGLDLPQLQVADSLAALGAVGAACRERFPQPVVGITGSAGKTSTKEMMHRLLGAEQTHATRGNWNNLIGVPMTLSRLDPERHAFGVIEAGINQPGEMAKMGAMIAADLCIITHIGPAHLELLGSLEGIAREKSQLVAGARRGAALIAPAGVMRYPAFAAFSESAIVVAGEGEAVPEGLSRVVRYRAEPAPGGWSTIQLAGPSREGEFRVRSRSRGICRNAALALLAAWELGVEAEELRQRLALWSPADSRGQLIEAGGRLFYVDCYNANPASMQDSLESFVDSIPSSRRRLYILGGMNELGPEAACWHREIGAALRPRLGDLACFVGPEEWTRAYREGALGAGWEAGALQSVPSVELLHSLVAEFAGAIFLKGSRSYALESLLPRPIPGS